MSVTRETQLKELTVKPDRTSEERLASQRGEAQGYSGTQYPMGASRVHHREHQPHRPPPPGGCPLAPSQRRTGVTGVCCRLGEMLVGNFALGNRPPPTSSLAGRD